MAAKEVEGRMHSGEPFVVPTGVALEAGALESLGHRRTVVQLDAGGQYFAGLGNPVAVACFRAVGDL